MQKKRGGARQGNPDSLRPLKKKWFTFSAGSVFIKNCFFDSNPTIAATASTSLMFAVQVRLDFDCCRQRELPDCR